MKSPIKDKPLRNPGESLDAFIDKTKEKGVLDYLFIAFVFWIVTVLEWLRWCLGLLPHPIIFTCITLVMLIFTRFQYVKTLKKVKKLRQGQIGEKVVGQFLERLRETGAQVFHDVPGDGFNLDHVVIHSTGIYMIETKTLSKPDRGETRLVYDGITIRKGGIALLRDPIVQAKAASGWLVSLLKESTGRSFSARPVVVFPGWFIEAAPGASKSNVWVLNPKALPAYIKNSEDQLSPENVKLCSFHLSRYIRTYPYAEA